MITICTYELLCIGIVDPVHVSAMATCKDYMSAVDIDWVRPRTLDGVDITIYNITLEDVNMVTNGDETKVVVHLPDLNPLSCEVRNVCVAASTLAGWSNWSCTDVIALEGINSTSQ